MLDLGRRSDDECISLMSPIDRVVETRLVGIASYQLSAIHIVCQGFERIEHCLVSVICQQLGG